MSIWLRPVAGALLGAAVAFAAFLAYRGSPSARWAPSLLRRPGDPVTLTGSLLVAAALLMGLAGFLLEMNLRAPRIAVAAIGLALLVAARFRGRR